MTIVQQTRLAELEETIERGLATFVAVGLALLEIRDNRLYRADYERFEDYCRERWDFSSRHVNRLIESAEVIQMIEDGTHGSRPENERQTRALAQAGEPEDVREVWAVVSASAEPVTAKKIEQAVTQHKRQKTRVEWACRTCGEVFAHPVWHCETCDEHWPMDVRTCPDCAPEPVETQSPMSGESPAIIEPSRQVEALQRGLTALRDAARLGATDGMVTNRTNSLIRDLERLIVDARRARGELV